MIAVWSSDFTTDPPTLTFPLRYSGKAAYKVDPDEASWLHHILGEFLKEAREVASRRDGQ